MNILVPQNWLKEIVKTNKNISDIANLLTLRSSSVEYIKNIEGDFVLDIEITPNRGDNLSILGIARELTAILKAEKQKVIFNNPLKDVYTENFANKDLLKVQIENPKLSPRFTACVIENITIKESPQIIKQRLKQVGIRPINNIVDLTNYIMIETGQPMHAFDYDSIKGSVMKVRESKEGESIITLDGAKRVLPKGSIVIEDSEKIIDLCGIMGGANSQIKPDTKRVVLFTQIYDPKKIRKTSLKLNHRTEAALRFEKSIDRELPPKALLRSLKLLKQQTNFKIASKLYDINTIKPKNSLVTLTYQKLYLYANQKIEKQIVKNILKALQFEIIKQGKNFITVKVPSFREQDVSIEEDLIEEVIRIYGYEKIDLKLPPNFYKKEQFSKKPTVERLTKMYLSNAGFNEVITYTMVPKKYVDLKKAVKIINPLGKEMSYIRTSLEPSLNQTLELNKKYKEINIYEVGKIYLKNNKKLPTEKEYLALLSSGNEGIYKIKDILKNLFKVLNIDNYTFKYPNKRQINIYINNKKCGFITVKPKYTYAQIRYKHLVKAYKSYPTIRFNPPYAIIKEDLTIHINLDDLAGDIINKISRANKYITKVEIKDDYNKGKNRALTITIYYQNPKRNLTANEMTEIRNSVINYIESVLKKPVDRPNK